MATVSVRQIALRLGTDPRVVRGILIGLGISPVRTPAADLVSEEDAARIERAYRARTPVPAAS